MMLALARRCGEAVLVYPEPNLDPDLTVKELFADGPIAFTVLKMKGNQVRITVDAPRALTILRNELEKVAP